jgi:hypothetical protein
LEEQRLMDEGIPLQYKKQGWKYQRPYSYRVLTLQISQKYQHQAFQSISNANLFPYFHEMSLILNSILLNERITQTQWSVRHLYVLAKKLKKGRLIYEQLKRVYNESYLAMHMEGLPDLRVHSIRTALLMSDDLQTWESFAKMGMLTNNICLVLKWRIGNWWVSVTPRLSHPLISTEESIKGGLVYRMPFGSEQKDFTDWLTKKENLWVLAVACLKSDLIALQKKFMQSNGRPTRELRLTLAYRMVTLNRMSSLPQEEIHLELYISEGKIGSMESFQKTPKTSNVKVVHDVLIGWEKTWVLTSLPALRNYRSRKVLLERFHRLTTGKCIAHDLDVGFPAHLEGMLRKLGIFISDLIPAKMIRDMIRVGDLEIFRSIGDLIERYPIWENAYRDLLEIGLHLNPAFMAWTQL